MHSPALPRPARLRWVAPALSGASTPPDLSCCGGGLQDRTACPLPTLPAHPRTTTPVSVTAPPSLLPWHQRVCPAASTCPPPPPRSVCPAPLPASSCLAHPPQAPAAAPPRPCMPLAASVSLAPALPLQQLTRLPSKAPPAYVYHACMCHPLAGCLPSQIPRWDTSKLRPKGSRLKTFGGRASGPEPLESLFLFAVQVRQRAGQRA